MHRRPCLERTGATLALTLATACGARSDLEPQLTLATVADGGTRADAASAVPACSAATCAD
jgi:hypothetical protein